MPKQVKDEIRLVSDFRRLNAALVRPVYPVESNTQLMRHLEPTAYWFATLDMVSGYHQVAVDERDRHLLTVFSTQGRFQYNSLSQGLCSASDLFNYLSDGKVRYDRCWRKILKNMDDVLFSAESLKELEEMLEEYSPRVI